MRYVLLSAFWLTALLTSDFPFATRYVSALAVVLLFVGIDPRRDALLAWRRALFGLALFAAVLFEPAQAVYALVAIAVFAVCELVADRTEVGGIVRRTLATIAAPAALGVLVYWLLDSVSGSIDVYRSFLLASSAYARPGQVDGWVVHPTTLASFVFWAMPLTIALGLSGFMVASRRARLPYAAAAALGVLSLMIRPTCRARSGCRFSTGSRSGPSATRRSRRGATGSRCRRSRACCSRSSCCRED